jgi:hypothetical protein
MKNWEYRGELDISWWHCDRAAEWVDDEVYCTKCGERMEETNGN